MVQHVGTVYAAATSVTLPTHQAGDLIVVAAVRYGNTTVPSLPAGYTSLLTSATTHGRRLGYKIAASSSETSGTWTNASTVVAAVYRGVTPGDAATSTTAAPGLTLSSAGESWAWLYHCYYPVYSPSGWTTRLDLPAADRRISDSAAPLASWAGESTGTDFSFALELIPPHTYVTATVGAATAAGTVPAVAAPHSATVAATVGAAGASGTAPAVVASRDWGDWRTYVWDADFIAAVESPQRIIGYRAEMIDSTGRSACDLPITSGSVDFDGESTEQWACSLTVVGGEWIPQGPSDPLDPRSGLRCRLWWRIKIGAQWLEVPIGTYWIEDPRISDDGPVAVIQLTGRDQLAIIRRSGYGSATVAVGGLTVPAAIARIMGVVAPATALRMDATSTVTLPDPYEVGARDPLEDIVGIAAQAGLIVYTDREGAVLVTAPPAPETIRANWQEGDDCPVVSLGRDIATSEMVNSVTVVSTSPDVQPSVSATAEDDDPSSPTYIGGVWGRRGITIRSDAVASMDGAAGLARTTLEGRRRPTESVEVQVPGRGDLGYRDLVALARAESGVGGLFRVAKWRLPITAPDQPPPRMTVTMQTRSLV